MTIETPSRTWRTTLNNALIITRREVRDSFRDWRIVTPIIILALVFPFLAQWMADQLNSLVTQQTGREIVAGRSIPFFLMIVGFFPISISLVIALETFVGEKERRSLEPLLSTPLSNTELYIGKALSAMIPPLLASITGMTVYLLSVIFNDLTWRPQPALILQIFLLTIVQALVMVTGAVVVSSQTTSTRAANLLASFIIIPMTLLINFESLLMFSAPDAESPYGIGALWSIIVAMAIVVVLLLRIGTSIFNRQELLGRAIDNINLPGTFRKIGRYIRAIDDDGTPAASLLQWYRRSIPLSLKRLRTAMLVTCGVFVAFMVGGMIASTLPQFQIPLIDAFSPEAEALDDFGGLLFSEAFWFIIVQNVRVLLLTALLSLVSLGTIAFIIPPVTFAILGYLLVQFSRVGLTGFMAVAILPHGIIEIPMILIATAASFRLGAAITKPPKGQTVGHVWILACADAIKLAIGVVLPGLVLAAFIEAFITVPLAQGYLVSSGF